MGGGEVSEVLATRDEIATGVLLRMRQQHRGTGLQRGVTVRDGPLQGERGRERVHVIGVGLDLLRRHEAQVVVTVGHLRRTPGIDDVDLRGHLVRRPEPGS